MKVKYVSFVAATVCCMIGSGALAQSIDIGSNACNTGNVNLSNAPVIMNTYERPVVLNRAAVIEQPAVFAAPACGTTVLQQPAVIAAPACGTTVLQQSAVLAPAVPIGVIKPRRHWFELSAFGMGLGLGGGRRMRAAAPMYVEQNLGQSAIIEGNSCQPAVVDACGVRSAVVEQTLSQPALIDNSRLMNSKTLYDYPATIAAPAQAIVQEQVVQPAVVEQKCVQPAPQTIMLHDTETTVTKITKHTMRRVYKKCATKRIAKKHCARQIRRRACDMGS